MSKLTLDQEQAIYDSLVVTNVLAFNKQGTESYVTLSTKSLEIDPNRKTAFEFLSKYDGKVFAGRRVTKKKHTIQSTGEICDAISLAELPEWIKLIQA